jgi:hypothetical protein
MTDKPTPVRIPPDLRDRIDALRGHVPRETWVRVQLLNVVDTLEHNQPARTPCDATSL